MKRFPKDRGLDLLNVVFGEEGQLSTCLEKR